MPAETHVVDGPLDRDAIFAIVRDQLVDILEIDPENISEGQSFKDDLNADSFVAAARSRSLRRAGSTDRIRAFRAQPLASGSDRREQSTASGNEC